MPTQYIRKGWSQKSIEARKRARLHNSYLGFVAMGRKHMMQITTADTTAHEAKLIAQKIDDLFMDLHDALKERIDP